MAEARSFYFLPFLVFIMKKITLKLNYEFRRLYARGKSCASGTVVVYAMKNRNNNDNLRFGLTVSKTVGNAVKRNRAKRLMREAFYKLNDCIKSGYDFVIVARTRINGKKSDTVLNDFSYALRKLDLLKNEENNTEID